MINYFIFSMKFWFLFFDMLLSLDWWNWNTVYKVLYRLLRCKIIFYLFFFYVVIFFKIFGVRAEFECMKIFFLFWFYKIILF